MASMVSKIARAAFATRASSSAAGGIAGGARPAAAISVSAAGGPKSEEEEETARPKSEVVPFAATRPYDTRLSVLDDSVFKSDEAMWAFYEFWCKYHGISRDRREMERRFKTFSDTARYVHEMNSVVGWSGEVSMTQFADMTNKEKSRLLCRPRRK